MLTDDEAERRLREILRRVAARELPEREAMTAIGLVLSPGALSFEQVATQVRCGVGRIDRRPNRRTVAGRAR